MTEIYWRALEGVRISEHFSMVCMIELRKSISEIESKCLFKKSIFNSTCCLNIAKSILPQLYCSMSKFITVLEQVIKE